jgi:hypothetical protein
MKIPRKITDNRFLQKRVLSIDTNGYQLKGQQSRIGESITDGAILKAEG